MTPSRPARPLQLSTQTLLDTPVLRIEGAIDPDDAPVFERAAWDALGREGTRIVLDLERCTHVSSAGLAVLFSLARWARSKDGLVIAVRPTAELLHLLQLVRLTDERGFRVTLDMESAAE